MNAAEVGIFVDGATRYFEVATAESATIGSPYFSKTPVTNDYSGVIAISGRRCGQVRFSAPRAMLAMILRDIGDPEAGEGQLADLVGEIANVISGYARKHFGRRFRISVPRVERGSGTAAAARGAVLVIPIAWRQQDASIVLNLA